MVEWLARAGARDGRGFAVPRFDGRGAGGGVTVCGCRGSVDLAGGGQQRAVRRGDAGRERGRLAAVAAADECGAGD